MCRQRRHSRSGWRRRRGLLIPYPKASTVFHHKAGAYRSGLEESIQAQLKAAGVEARYEPGRIRYTPSDRHYTPDFILPNGVVIETKGYFAPEDRTKHLLIKAQHPNLELRFVFQRPRTRLYPGSKSTYASWCEQHGFLWAYKTIPQEWLDEPITETRINAVKEVLITKCAK